MGQTRLINICQDILSRWREKKEIDEEQSYIFMDGILDVFSNPEEETGADYRKVSEELNEMWQYRDFGSLSVEEVFLCGSLWGGIKMAELNRKRLRQQSTIKELSRAYANKLWFFEAISYEPGIRHKDLAQKGGQSTSQLSQFVAGVVKEGLITYNRIGREKYYYLQKRGELVYAELKKQHDLEYQNQMKMAAGINDEISIDTVSQRIRANIQLLSLGQMMSLIQGNSITTEDRAKLTYKFPFALNNYENSINDFNAEKEEFDILCQEMEPAMVIANN